MVHKVLRIGKNQPGEMGIVCTKGEGAHTHTRLTEGSDCSEACQVDKAHGGEEKKDVTGGLNAHVKRGTEFHRKLEVDICSGLVCRRISPCTVGQV